MPSHLTGPFIRPIAAFVLVVGLASAPAQSFAQAPPKARLITPCADKAQTLPITQECVAAALAEKAFLDETHHQNSRYVISPMQHTQAEWHFIILLGDEKHPPPPGGAYMAFIDRRTGKVELIPEE
jgi:hypothetical protein